MALNSLHTPHALWVCRAGDRLKEATKINLSLSALGNVISALVDGKSGEQRQLSCIQILLESSGLALGQGRLVMADMHS